MAGLHAVKATIGTNYTDGFGWTINNCTSLNKELKENYTKPVIMNTIKEIGRVLGLLPDYIVSKINRSANQVAHNFFVLTSSSRLFNQD
jgi:hypothetical protein